MIRRSRILPVAALVVLLAGACGGDDDAAPGDEPAPTENPVTEQAAGDEGASDPAAAPTATAADPEPTEPPTVTPTPEPDLVLPGSAAITQLTATEGGGARPLLEWEPLDEAGTYYVVVYDDAGDPYWAAVTDQASVYVGGQAQIPDDRDGPRIADGYTWAVYADAVDGSPLGASPLRPVSP